jgi:hypothetical protein
MFIKNKEVDMDNGSIMQLITLKPMYERKVDVANNNIRDEFNVDEIITRFNQAHQTHIQSNKTWGFVYLRPKWLAFLKQSSWLIYDSEAYQSAFVVQRQLLHNALARIKAGLVTERLPVLRSITQQLRKDHHKVLRLKWEDCLKDLWGITVMWEQRLKEIEDPIAKLDLEQLFSQWQIHKAFQYHSSQGLLFLLHKLIDYKQHFILALQELHKKQNARFSWQPLPDFVAKPYLNFLDQQLSELELLQPKVIEALLLRLKTVEHNKQVGDDDVSYSLAQQAQTFKLPLPPGWPEMQTSMDSNTFNQLQRAIEKYGDDSQKQQLYQLSWYRRIKMDSILNITTIRIAHYHLLIPQALINFVPTARKPVWLFSQQKDYLPFLETQQALLAQLILPMESSNIPLESVSLAHPRLQALVTRYQLLQQGLAQPCSTHWWQWRKKQYKKHWQDWLGQRLKEIQTDLLIWLSILQQHLQAHPDVLDQPAYHLQIQEIVPYLQSILTKNPSYACPFLAATLASLSLLLHEKVTASMQQPARTSSLIQHFKKDLATALENYMQQCNNLGLTLSARQNETLCQLRGLLKDADDVLHVREEFMQHYRKLARFQFIKLFAPPNHSILQRKLRIVLENPNYSVAALKQEAETLASTQANLTLNHTENISIEKQRVQSSVHNIIPEDNPHAVTLFFKKSEINDGRPTVCFAAAKTLAK